MNEKIYAEILLQSFLKNKKNPEEFEKFFKKLVAFLKSKDKQAIVPKIFEIFENQVNNFSDRNKTVLTVKEASDVEKFSKEIMKSGFNIENVEIKEDKNITGGFILQDNTKILDNSYKAKLLNAYRNIIAS